MKQFKHALPNLNQNLIKGFGVSASDFFRLKEKKVGWGLNLKSSMS
jgi:hypothetical protein